jgi:hypothetical protein
MSAANESMPHELNGCDLATLQVWLQRNPPRPRGRWRKRVRGAGGWLLMAALLTWFIIHVSQSPPSSRMGEMITGGLIAVLGVALLNPLWGWVWELLPWASDAVARTRLAQPLTEMLSEPVNRWFTAPCRTIVAPEGITEASSQYSVQYSWSVVWCVVGLPDHALFLLGTQHGLVVPRRAFLSDEHFREFVSLAMQYRTQALSPSTEQPAPP